MRSPARRAARRAASAPRGDTPAVKGCCRAHPRTGMLGRTCIGTPGTPARQPAGAAQHARALEELGRRTKC
eukprot:scaffold15146_cov129-Isochrysis_galbana.AAC.1